MKYIIDGTQMKQLDKYTVESIGIPTMVLMEKSAVAVVDVMLDKIKKEDKILAVCGTGNNGGDGVATARILKEKGFDVAILILGDEKRATEQTKAQLVIAKNLGVSVFNNVKIDEYNIIVDAIFGIGLSKMVEGIFKTVIKSICDGSHLVFSVDIPSGIHSTSGKVMNIAVQADYTITFGLNKKGLILYPGSEYAGKVVVADIGFPKIAVEKINSNTFTLDPSDLHMLPNRTNYSHKGIYGKVLVIAGSKNMCGACYLSSKAAYRTGAGLVKILTVEDNRNIMQTTLPEAILSTYHPGELKSKLEVERIIKELTWATAIVLGPGIGLSAGADQLIDIVLQYANVPVVMDADALTLLAKKEAYIIKNALGEQRLHLPSNVIITPHLKEMSRLLGCEVSEIADDLINMAVNSVDKESYILALKDARTVVTDGKKIYLNMSGNHGMATGGSGDVLTGIIVGLLAQGMEPFKATFLGVYVHGLAADYAVKGKSCYSLIASDIIEALPYVLKEEEEKVRYQ